MRSKTILTYLIFQTFLLCAQENKKTNFSFIAFGDMPYNLPQDYKRFENVIKTINSENPAFSVNVGDFKSSSTPCSAEAYNKILNYYEQFNNPLIYVPGDNEWTDCSKKEAGAYDPEERLSIIRKTFFKDNKSFGKENLILTSQSQKPEFSKFVENNKWEYKNVSFATVHIVGSNNNFLPTSKNGNQEFFEREKADLAWLEEVFKTAKEKDHYAVVIVIHADMFSGSKDLKEVSGFNQIKLKLKELTQDFKKPVLLINGDTHNFLIDKPLIEDDKSKKNIDNFTRLQVFGENNMHAVKITIDINSKSIFQFEEVHVDGN
jgi:hypothetical protein